MTFFENKFNFDYHVENNVDMLSVSKTPQPLRIMAIGHHAYQPSCLSVFMPNMPPSTFSESHTYLPSCL